MVSSPRTLTALLTALTLTWFGQPVNALLRFNESRDQIFVNVGASMVYDSNIFNFDGSEGDTIYTGSLSIDYERRAGLIGVTATVGFDIGRFDEFSSENYQNPNYRFELAKNSGRTTGSLTGSIHRESRADPDANLRTTSWHYDTALNLKYPVIERYSFSAAFGYGLRDYDDNTILVDLASYLFGADLFYVFTTERDLLAGYRLRVSETSADTSYYDHHITAGMSGKIFYKLNGTVRVGYQLREGRGPGTTDDHNLTVSASTTWDFSRKANLQGELSRDYRVTSTNGSVDSLTGSLNARYVFNVRLTSFAGIDGGENRFMGDAAGNRVDKFLSTSVGLGFMITPSIRGDVAYTTFRNWSTLSVANFTRESYSLNLKARF